MIYVSGRVDINNIDHYRSQFEQAKEYLMNDVRVYEDSTVTTWIEWLDGVMKHIDILDYTMCRELEDRIEIVKHCNRLYLLKGWEQDDMCRLEHTVAKAYSIPITYSKKF